MCQQENIKQKLNIRSKRPKAKTEEERKQRTKEYQREYQARRRRENAEANERHRLLCKIHNDYAKKAVAYCKERGITFDDDE